MSTDEQDQILGRLIRERRDCERNIAALESKVKGAAYSFRELARLLDGVNTFHVSPETVVTAVDNSRGKESITGTLQELAEERTKLDDLKAQLARFD